MSQQEPGRRPDQRQQIIIYAIGITLGAALGVAIGVVTGNIAIGAAVGIGGGIGGGMAGNFLLSDLGRRWRAPRSLSMCPEVRHVLGPHLPGNTAIRTEKACRWGSRCTNPG